MNIIKWKPDMEPAAGSAYSGMPNHVYHGFREWYGSSSLKHTRRSVESFFYEIAQPQKPSMALERGTAVHAGIEGLVTTGTMDLFHETVVECSGRTVNSKDWQNVKSSYPDAAVLPLHELNAAEKMAQKLYQAASDVNYFDLGYAELSIFWIDEETDIRLKCRPDWLIPGEPGWCLDYKTSKSHHEEGFSKAIYEYFYHFSAAMYLEGMLKVYGTAVDNYQFLVVANTPPYEVEAYALDLASLAEGRAVFREALSRVANHKRGEKLKPKAISLPPWGFKLT